MSKNERLITGDVCTCITLAIGKTDYAAAPTKSSGRSKMADGQRRESFHFNFQI